MKIRKLNWLQQKIFVFVALRNNRDMLPGPCCEACFATLCFDNDGGWFCDTKVCPVYNEPVDYIKTRTVSMNKIIGT